MDAITQRIAELVATPSVSAVRPELDMPNRAVVDVLANWLEHEGFAIEILPITDDGKKANLIATKGRGPGGLVLSGHTDTVPFDEGKWTSDPFRLTERDGKRFAPDLPFNGPNISTYFTQRWPFATRPSEVTT